VKKQLRWLFCGLCLVAVVMCVAAPGSAAPKKQAKFARVAILPVICLQSDIDYANTIVFQKASELFKYPDYEIYDGDRLYKALQDVNYYEAGKTAVTESMLRTVMEKAGLDMIVAIKLNRLVQRSASGSNRDSLEELTLDMDVMAIYGWRPKITQARVRETRTADYAAIMKTNWKMQEYGSTVGFYLERIAKTGKQ